MGREIKIEIPGMLYHVINRGNNKNNIFLDEQDYNVFLKKIKSVQKDKDFILYCYCLMPNHFHLLIEMIAEPISKIMQQLLTYYAIYFNAKYKTTGHVFQGRYKSIVCDKEEYLLKLLQYIHLNPMRAKLTKSIDNYKWSSHNYYIGKRQDDLLAVEKLFNYMGLSKQRGCKLYGNLIREFIKDYPKDFFEQKPKNNMLGSDDFVKNILKAVDKNVKIKEKSLNNADKKTLSEILVFASQKSGVSKDSMLSESQSPDINYARKVFYYIAAKDFGYTLKEIASFVNRDMSIVSKGVSEIKRKGYK